ncbi:glycoside hydrolase family 127 protein [Microbacterium oryzae]|uniref:Glycosyl hydrolase n=1 Tax=Microbacterium oryzae TaxID=743009 RepID=A0A6I6E0T5_9MICO|nr:beta-L-arabinofuranosidase domain-containing protein [Microbacterium oryzae]QGU27549.1 glycosyl hydrolase [Microbacterium oryzae]
MTVTRRSPVTRRHVLRGGLAFAGIVAGTAVLGEQAARAAGPSAAAFRTPGHTHAMGAVRASQTLVYPEAWKVRPFPLSAVKLGKSVFTRALDQHLVLFRAYPVDKILAVYRRNAGLATAGATPPGGWEEYGPAPDAQRWGPREYKRGQNTGGAGGLLRGHYGGHFLSGVSMAYAATGETALLDKVNAIVDGLEECRAALAAQEFDGAPRYSHPGFLSAYGEWQFSALEEYAPYGEIWAPYYTLHKILAGLLDAHALAGNAKALELAEGIGHWVLSRLSRCTQAQLDRMWGSYIAGEYGGMNEVLVELYWRSADPLKQEFLDAADRFTLRSLVDACAAGTDILNGKHANQHIPQFPGYLKLAAETGDRHFIDATRGMYDMVVPGRMYAHGGTGEGELWGPAGSVAGDIGPRNAESCAAYNMLKVASGLFFDEPDARYMDYFERTVLNHILGGRRNRESTTGPENLYMFPVHPGARKEYGNGNIGTCCGGTGLESHVKYQEGIYFRSADQSELYVNLYLASTLVWEETGLELRQESSYPEGETSTLTIVTAPSGPLDVHLRVPGWSTGVEITVNGEPADAEIAPGSYATISRTWAAGDVIAVRIPLRLRPEATPDRADIQALMYGPVVLTAVSSSTNYLKVSLADHLGLDGTVTRGVAKRDGNVFAIGDLSFEPAYAGRDVAYHMYFQRQEPTVSFAGRDSGVANPRRDETTLLDEIWAQAPFADRSAFLEAVAAVSADYVSSGLLTTRSRQKILLAAGRAPMES